MTSHRRHPIRALNPILCLRRLRQMCHRSHHYRRHLSHLMNYQRYCLRHLDQRHRRPLTTPPHIQNRRCTLSFQYLKTPNHPHRQSPQTHPLYHLLHPQKRMQMRSR